jgi:hypothetical protein
MLSAQEIMFEKIGRRETQGQYKTDTSDRAAQLAACGRG